ncbi:thiamine pyrophosphate-dependent enzyme [Embleya hyalina]|uniref:Benzoylformate decarboxylase n=1 Tax=Embleya hyalina TaxID=516124 RepID=A0A401YF98_9ACTN|nr:thiamine pyrophosphate-dependent enzyme [Embleya hyalina]GCD93247.1 benzoylformate decarboxylase [Embleya hyalina]
MPQDRVVDPTGAELVCEILVDEGATHVFGNPGTTEIPFVRALAGRDDIEYVLGLQEATVVAMADGMARLTGRPTFVSLHAAAGLGNGIGALTNAAAAHVPMVVTAGQQDLRHLLSGPVLAGDLAGLAEPTVKWAHEVRTRAEVGPSLRRAFRLALSPPTGPVFLSLPMNLLDERGPSAPERTPAAIRGAAPIDALTSLLDRTPADGVALVYGDEVARSAPAEGIALAETLRAPVWGASWPSANPFPTTHDLWRGYLPPTASGIRETLSDHRLVLVLGARAFLAYFPYAPGPVTDAGTRVVQISDEPDDAGRTTPVELALHGDLRATIARLSTALTDRPRRDAGPASPGPEAAGRAHANGPLDARSIAHVLAATLPDDAVILDEAPVTTDDLRHALRLHRPNRYQWVAGGLGWAMPAAVGAAMAPAREGKRVLCVVGDGSALYSPQALWTAARHRLPITYVVVDNGEYRVLKDNWQIHTPGDHDHSALDLDRPRVDFVALARSMGVEARSVTDNEDLRRTLTAAHRHDRPTLIKAHLPQPPTERRRHQSSDHVCG